MGSKVWLVCERGWEYDDNNYYCNDDAGSPVKGYTSEEKAKAVAKERNFDRIRELIESREIMSYLRDDGWAGLIKDERNGPQLVRLLVEHGLETDGEYGDDYTLPEDGLPETFWEKLLELSPANLFYTVTWVTMEGK